MSVGLKRVKARREMHNRATHIEIVPIQSVDALVAVTFHQRFDFTALGFLIVMLTLSAPIWYLSNGNPFSAWSSGPSMSMLT